MARPHHVNKIKGTLPEPARATAQSLQTLADLPLIPQPKPWSDDLERAWIYRTSCGTPMHVAGVALGLSESSVKFYLSEDPPITYSRACKTLLDRLKTAEAVAHDEAVTAVRAAWGKAWQSAAWYLERKHGYIVQQAQNLGPSTVVNIGQVVVNGTLATPERAAIIEAVPIQAEQTPSLVESVVVGTKA
jgi:hypothetical protein